MKKTTVLLLTLALLVGLFGASAEGVLTVAQENFHVVGTDSFTGYLYVRLENTGDAPVSVDRASLEIYDAQGNVLATSTALWRHAEFMQPGESCYAYFNPTIQGIESADQVADYKAEITGRSQPNRVTFRLPVETVFEDEVAEGSRTNDYITTTLTNDADQTIFDIVLVRALLDDAGNILYIDSDNMYAAKGLTPGSSIVVRKAVNRNSRDYLAEKGYVPTRVESIGYVYAPDMNTYTRGGAPAAEREDAPAEAPQAEETHYATLSKGSKGEEVRALQQRLKALGYLSGSADGDFGKGTARAVSAFQERAGLPASGVADDATQRALFADDAPGA